MTVLDTSNGIFVNRTHAYIILQARRERVISDPNEAFKAWHAAQPSVLTENFFRIPAPLPLLFSSGCCVLAYFGPRVLACHIAMLSVTVGSVWLRFSPTVAGGANG